MTFFEQQERARRRTGWLVALFALAVVLIGAAIYVLAAVFLARGAEPHATLGPVPWDLRLFAWSMGGTMGFVGLASAYRTASLASGGGAVARMMGGRPVDRSTSDPLERRLLNVVDEMAIASGVPVPDVYVLDGEEGINAFAAGWSTESAAIAVTRGALEQLDRDELQGVIGHEFSHILNGDMRLNIRLIGVLFGILAIAVVGRFFVHAAASSSRGRRSKKDNGALWILLVGLGLMIVGYIGVFVGRIIQAAVSRQREFLADASSVQFTRNPLGIGRALLTIARSARGAKLDAASTTEVNHLLFGEGSRAFSFFGLLASHPPIEERIRRVAPQLLDEGGDVPGGDAIRTAGAAEPAAAAGFAGGAPARRRRAARRVVESVGALDAAAIAQARSVLQRIPPALREATQTTPGAQATLLALLLSSDETVRAHQRKVVTDSLGGAAWRQALELADDVAALPADGRVALVEQAAAALRRLPAAERSSLVEVLRALAEADATITPFEFALLWLVEHRVVPEDGERARPLRSLRAVVEPTAHLLAYLSRAGGTGPAAEEAFSEGLGLLAPRQRDGFVERFRQGELGGRAAVSLALEQLRAARPAVAQRIIEALALCALADREVIDDEAVLLRFFSLALGCPVPQGFLSASQQATPSPNPPAGSGRGCEAVG